jgi:hypothetical protein
VDRHAKSGEFNPALKTAAQSLDHPGAKNGFGMTNGDDDPDRKSEKNGKDSDGDTTPQPRAFPVWTSLSPKFHEA